MVDNTYYIYDPVGSGIPKTDPNSEDHYFMNNPISTLPLASFNVPGSKSEEQHGGFLDIASRHGTIYIYGKPSGYVRDESLQII